MSILLPGQQQMGSYGNDATYNQTSSSFANNDTNYTSSGLRDHMTVMWPLSLQVCTRDMLDNRLDTITEVNKQVGLALLTLVWEWPLKREAGSVTVTKVTVVVSDRLDRLIAA